MFKLNPIQSDHKITCTNILLVYNYNCTHIYVCVCIWLFFWVIYPTRAGVVAVIGYVLTGAA